MQFCPRCGTQNQDSRAACWKCFGLLRTSDSKKPQLIVMADRDTPSTGIHATAAPEVDVVPAASVPIPELAVPEPEVGLEAPVEAEPAVPVFQLDEPALEPEVAEPSRVDEPAPAVAPLGDVLLPSPTFDASSAEEEEPPTQPVPILGLIHTGDTEPEPVDADEPEEPVISFGGLSEAPRIVESPDDVPASQESGEPLPWWMSQDESEDASVDSSSGTTIDLDGGLELISLDDDSGPASPDGEDDDSKQPPGA